MSGVDRLYDDIRAYKRSRVLATAMHLGILTALKKKGPTVSVTELATDTSIATNWLTTILMVLCRYGLVKAEGESYSLTVMGHEAEKDSALRAFSGYHCHCFDAWAELPRAVLSSKGTDFHRKRIQDKDFCEAYLASMVEMAKPQVGFFEKACPPLLKGRVLDIGAGSAYFCRHFAQSNPDVSVTALDFEKMAQSAKELYGESANFKWVAGDFLSWEAPLRFDAAYCGHLLEYCPEEELSLWLRRIRSFIREDGVLVLVVFLRNGDSDPCDDLDLFEISTGLNGANLGHIPTKDEMTDQLKGTGFSNIDITQIPEGPSYSEYLITCRASGTD